MKKRFSSWMLVIYVVILPLIVYASYEIMQAKSAMLPVLSPKDHTIENFKLVNQLGDTVNNIILNGKVTVVNFFYASCGTICPKMTSQLNRVQQQFNNDDRIRILSITVDPQHDDVSALKCYADMHEVDANHWMLLTGDKKLIYDLARYGFNLPALEGDGGPNDFIHSERLVLLDQQQQVRGYYDGTDEKSVDALMTDIKKLLPD